MNLLFSNLSDSVKDTFEDMFHKDALTDIGYVFQLVDKSYSVII